MTVFAREVFVCKFRAWRTPAASSGGSGGVEFRRGTIADLARLDSAHRTRQRAADFERRLGEGEYWHVGLQGDCLVTYSWLQMNGRLDYPYLPGCTFALRDDAAHGYDAFTSPDARGRGLRRLAFAEELEVVRRHGRRWEVGVFVKHQFDDAVRSLGIGGIQVTPLWRATASAAGLEFEKLADDDLARPLRAAIEVSR